MELSKLARSVKPSATLAAGAKARELRAKGVDVVDFSLGEPDFDTPMHIRTAAIAAMNGGQTHYTPAAGSLEVRKAVAHYYCTFHNYDCGPEHVIVSNGAKHSIHNALVSLTGPGDEVIIPTPYWVSYGDLVEMAGAMPVLVPCPMEAGFKMTPSQLAHALTPRTRLLMLNSPCNPTGAVYSKAELEALMNLLEPHPQVTILSDEIYEHLVYGDAQATCVATLKPWLRDRTITISGASKSYAMTGWRMGWAVAPAAAVKAMDAIQSQETSCPNSVSQAALIAALSSPESRGSIEAMRVEFAARRDLVTQLLGDIPGIRFAPPDGAFYAFFDIRPHLRPGRADSIAFCLAALEEAHVNFVPGAAFGMEGFARMSFACNRETITRGLTALKAWLANGRA